MHLEYKYLIPVSAFSQIKKEMLPYLILDKHAEHKKNKDYTVRSIYYDTLQLRYYFEKIEGLKVRKKVRIRVYDHYFPEIIAFLEIKHKNEGFVCKIRSQLLLKNIDKFFETHNAEKFIIYSDNDGRAVNDARMFLYYFNQENLRPTLLVTYEREPFYYKFDRNLRITFDKNLRFLPFANHQILFEENKLLPALNNKIIIEMKFFQTLPLWLTNILSRYGLQRMALSKYTLCLEADKNFNIARLVDKQLLI